VKDQTFLSPYLVSYAALAIIVRGRNKRAVGSGSGGTNRLPMTGAN
jgi:hypothetical protein